MSRWFLFVLAVVLSLQSGPSVGQAAAAALEIPEIHGATVYGARPKHPFLYRIPVTGSRPIAFAASGLPPGLRLDGKTGILSGTVPAPITREVTLRASNGAGSTKRRFRIVIGDELSLTPPMGWSSWDFLQSAVTDRDLRRQAVAMVSSGLIDHGYAYINLDDGWSMKRAGAPVGVPMRATKGAIQPNDRFPDMPALTAYLHRRGMKAGLYTSPGPVTCGGFEGSYGHEAEDAHQFALWGFDLLKYDLCSYPLKAHTQQEMQKPYRLMGALLKAEPRDISTLR